MRLRSRRRTSTLALLAVPFALAACDPRLGTPSADAESGVTLEYIAHASFLIHSPGGTSLLLDPFQGRVWLGYDFPEGIEPDAVAVTHPHYDHDAGVFRGSDFPWPELPLFTEAGAHSVGDLTVTGVQGKHADPYGMEFGQKNTLFVVEAGGIRIAHLGDNGPLTPENVLALGRVDVLLIPGDALDHILSEEATQAILEALDPRIVVPMHYRIPALEAEVDSPSGLGEVDDWLARRDNVVHVGSNRLTLTLASIPEERRFVVFDPSPTVERAVDPVSYAPPGTPIELGIAGYAKVLCSAVYVSGRDLAEASTSSGLFFLEPEQRPGVTDISLDEALRAVRVTHGDSITRSARFHGDQGCQIEQRIGEAGPFFTPVPVSTTLPNAALMPWPMGDVDAVNPEPEGIVRGLLGAAVEAAFADPEGLTAAFLVLHKGRIVAERYRGGITQDTQLESWSMGKSVTATLAGLLMSEGAFSLDDPVPVPAWREPGDERAGITVRHLFNMSSGLRFIAPRDPDYTPELGYPDHMFIYSGAVDAFEHSITRPLQFEPGSEGRYRNSDPLTLGWLIKHTVESRGEEYLAYPQRALFDRIGVRRQILETDPYGNFLLTGFDYGTARGWARLGLLYLHDGVWMNERLLPEGFVDFVRSPAPAWSEPVYVGLFWLNGTGEWSLPEDAYFMAGGGGQRTFIVPSLDLVVVRLGHFEGSAPGMAALDRALALLVQAVSAPSS